MNWPFPVYVNLTQEYILMEIELGERVARCQDNEDCGFGAIWDLSYKLYVEEYERKIL